MQCGGTSGAKPATEEINEIANKVDLVFHYWHKRLLIEIKEGFLKF